MPETEGPELPLKWSFFTADPSSPVFGQSVGDLVDSEATFVLLLSGLDENAAQELRARHSYDASLIRWGYRYADIIKWDERGGVSINYATFHDVVPEAAKA